VPETTVTKRPPKKTSAHKVKISFTSTVAGSTFLCTLDFKKPKPCQTPLKIKAGLGKHRLLVQALSPAYSTSDATPAKVRWKVVPRPRH
jgi:hypothetical protein